MPPRFGKIRTNASKCGRKTWRFNLSHAKPQSSQSKILTWRLCAFFFQAEDGIRYSSVTGVQTCALPISPGTTELDALDGGGHTEVGRLEHPLQSTVVAIGELTVDEHAESLLEAQRVIVGVLAQIGRASCRERV